MNENPERTKELMTDDIQAYLNILKGSNDNEKPVLTKNGAPILKFLQENQETKMWKAKDIADGLGRSSRGISGSMRKLVTEGFCEVMGKDPAVYTLTEKGKNYVIEETLIEEEN
jgi:predicted transcriptional regulator